MRATLTIASVFIFATVSLIGIAHAQTTTPTVAVLPFAGNASDPDFAGGLTDEIALALTKVPGLAVVGRSSVFTDRFTATYRHPD